MYNLAGFLLAHALFPSFPPFGVMLVIVLVVGGLIALAASKGRAGRRAGSNSLSIAPAAASESETAGSSESEGAEPGDQWWRLPALRIPIFTIVVCAATVPLSFVPGLNFFAGIIQMPGFIFVWALMMNDLLADDLGELSFVSLCALVSWVFWTIVASLVSPVIGRFRGEPDAPAPPTILNRS